MKTTILYTIVRRARIRRVRSRDDLSSSIYIYIYNAAIRESYITGQFAAQFAKHKHAHIKRFSSGKKTYPFDVCIQILTARVL